MRAARAAGFTGYEPAAGRYEVDPHRSRRGGRYGLTRAGIVIAQCLLACVGTVGRGGGGGVVGRRG